MFAKFMDYFTKNPVLTILWIGLALFVVILCIVALCFKKKPKPTEKERPNVEKLVSEKSKPDFDDSVRFEVPPVDPSFWSEDQAFEKKYADEKEGESVVTPTPEKAPQKKTKTPQKAVTSPAKAETTTKTTGKTEKNKTSAKVRTKEREMLLEELKDIDEGIDFYEEDEIDKIARYKGKWTICRIVTKENLSEEEETFFFELHASNGEKLLASEEYTTYNGALRGIQTHKNNILNGNFRISLTKKGEYVFKLCSGKNLLLCMGEVYSTRAKCENAIESAKRFAQTAVIDENIQDLIVKLPVEDDEPLPLPDGYNGKWIIKSQPDINGETVYVFELFASNGEKLLSSEEYATYIGAVNGIQTHKNNIEQGNFRVTLTKRGDYIYKLLNKNGQLLCLGEHYKTKRRCLNAVESVKRFAKNAQILTDSSNMK